MRKYTRLSGEQVQTDMVSIKPQDIGIGTVWMSSTVLIIFWIEHGSLMSTIVTINISKVVCDKTGH